MSERHYFIINRSTIALVDQARRAGGHGYDFKERPITFIGSSEPTLEAVNLSMAPLDLRCEILESWERVSSVVTKVQDI